MLAPFHPVLIHGSGTRYTWSPWLDPNLTPQSAFCKQVTGPLKIGSYNSLFPRGPPTYKSWKIVTGGSSCILVIDDSYQCCAFLPLDRLCTRVGLWCSVPSVPLVAIALIPPLPQNLLWLGSDIFHVLGFYTLYTILPPELLIAVSILILASSFPNTNLGSVLGFAELPTLSLATEFLVTSSLSLELKPRLRSSVVI